MDEHRINRIRAAMQEHRLDALVLRLPEHVVMAFGVWPMNGYSFGFFTATDGPVSLIAPTCEDQEMDACWASDIRWFTWPMLKMSDPHTAIQEHLKQLAVRHNVEYGRIGYEGACDTVAPAYNAGEVMTAGITSFNLIKGAIPKAKWIDTTSLLAVLCATKTPPEIHRLQRAHDVAAQGLMAFVNKAKPGISEVQLASSVYEACTVSGLGIDDVQHINCYPQISSGLTSSRAWRPIVSTSSRCLEASDTVVLELAVCVDGFWADVTRTVLLDGASPVQIRAYQAVEQAQQAACQEVRVGASAAKPHIVATQILIDAGFADQVTHLTGHGLGFRYHEPEPFLMPSSESLVLKLGHVMSVEPGLYDPQWGGIRIEDNVALTPTGPINLTRIALERAIPHCPRDEPNCQAASRSI